MTTPKDDFQKEIERDNERINEIYDKILEDEND